MCMVIYQVEASLYKWIGVFKFFTHKIKKESITESLITSIGPHRNNFMLIILTVRSDSVVEIGHQTIRQVVMETV